MSIRRYLATRSSEWERYPELRGEDIETFKASGVRGMSVPYDTEVAMRHVPTQIAVVFKSGSQHENWLLCQFHLRRLVAEEVERASLCSMCYGRGLIILGSGLWRTCECKED